MHHFLHDAGLHLVVKGIESKVRGRAHDVECGIEVKGSVRENESSGVYETKCEMQRSGSERWGGQIDGAGFVPFDGSIP